MSPLKVAYSLDELRQLKPRNSVVTLGVFDGVHRGHRSIIERLIDYRSTSHLDSAYLLTFDPHPVVVTHSRETPPILSTIDERLELLEQFALDGVFVLRFDQATMTLDYREFIDRYFLDALNMKALVLGYDCHFGHRREGSPERVREEGERKGFDVEIVPPLEIEGEVVSSTTIRSRLVAGELARANELLGHPYLVVGTVTQGHGRGAEIGFPTANLSIESPHKLWPSTGVYAVRAQIDGNLHRGMMNVGKAPTIKGEKDEIEVHIFDFDRAIYGHRVAVYCESYLRDEEKFDSVDGLIAQLHRDRESALAVLA